MRVLTSVGTFNLVRGHSGQKWPWVVIAPDGSAMERARNLEEAKAIVQLEQDKATAVERRAQADLDLARMNNQEYTAPLPNPEDVREARDRVLRTLNRLDRNRYLDEVLRDLDLIDQDLAIIRTWTLQGQPG